MKRWPLLVVAALAATGCEPEAIDASPLCRSEPPAAAGANELDVWSLRRLSRDELAHTFEALLGRAPEAVNQLPQDDPDLAAIAPAPSGFEVELYRQIATDAAGYGADALLERADCSDDRSCAQTAALAWIERAYRSPLPQPERDAYAALLAQDADPRPALRELLQLVFQSPRFLYVIERGSALGADDASRALTPYELATRLAYFLWSEPPDDALWRDAQTARLEDPERLRAHARRMLADERGTRALGHALRRWAAPELDVVAKTPAVYPEFDPELRDSMLEQFREFAALAIAEDYDLAALFTTRRAPLDARLSELLGLPAVDGWHLAELEAPRFGVLTLPGVLASHARADDSSPIARGLFIRQNVLCQPIPPPPPGVATLPPVDGAAVSFRERVEAHTADPVCAGCHRLMDPLGLPFEIYDGLGRLRRGAQADPGGQLDGIASPVAFADLSGLVGALLEAPEVSRCWAQQWLRRGLGPAAAADSALLDPLAARVAQGASIADLVVEIVSAPAFARVRRPVTH